MRGFLYLLNPFTLHLHPAAADHGGMKTQAPHKFTQPRDYAAAILAEASLERRKALMDRCPVEWRALVEEHVRDAFPKVVEYRKHQVARTEQTRQKPPAAPRRDAPLPRISDFKSSTPEVGKARLAELRAALGKRASA